MRLFPGNEKQGRFNSPCVFLRQQVAFLSVLRALFYFLSTISKCKTACPVAGIETETGCFNHKMLWIFADSPHAVVKKSGLGAAFKQLPFWAKPNGSAFFLLFITFFIDIAVFGAYLVVQSNPAESRYQLRATPTADEMLWFLPFGGSQSRVIETRKRFPV